MDTILQFGYIGGIVLSMILFFYNHGFKTANRFLAAFFFFTSLFTFCQYLGLYSQSLLLNTLFASSLTPFSFLIGPFFYLYIRSILRDNTRLSRYDYFHFVIFAVQFLGMIPYYFSSWEFKISIAKTILSNDWNITNLNVNHIFRSPINNYFRPIFLIAYLMMSWNLIIKYLRKPDSLNVPTGQQKLLRKWLLFIIITFTFLLLAYLMLTIDLIIFHKNKAEFRTVAGFYLLIISICLVTLNAITLLFPQILYGLPKIEFQKADIQKFDNYSQSKKELTYEVVNKNITTELSITNILLIDTKLKQFVQDSQPWKNEHFSIASLAIDLNLPEHHLRFYFNHHLNITFPTYKNRLRVDHVKNIIETGKHQNLTLEGIGRLAGFSSKSSFFAVFKSETGISPHEYQEKFQNK